MAGYYQEVKSSYVCNRESSSATIKTVVPWADAPAFCVNMIGGLVYIGGIPVYQIGAAHPFLPGMYCNNVAIEPVGDYDATLGDFADAWATISYAPLDQPESPSATQVGEISYDIQCEEITLEKNLFTVNGNAMEGNDINPVLVNPKMNVSLSYKNLPDIPITNWLNYVGKVNSATFEGFEAETVMFMNPRKKRTISSDGTETYEYEFCFEVRFNGWNKVYRPGGWVALSPKIYETINMSGVLPV